MKKLLIIGAVLAAAVINSNAQTNLPTGNRIALAKSDIQHSATTLEAAFWVLPSAPQNQFGNPFKAPPAQSSYGTPILSMTNQISPVVVAITGNTNWPSVIAASSVSDGFKILALSIQNASDTTTTNLTLLQGESAALAAGVAALGN